MWLKMLLKSVLARSKCFLETKEGSIVAPRSRLVKIPGQSSFLCQLVHFRECPGHSGTLGNYALCHVTRSCLYITGIAVINISCVFVFSLGLLGSLARVSLERSKRGSGHLVLEVAIKLWQLKLSRRTPTKRVRSSSSKKWPSWVSLLIPTLSSFMDLCQQMNQ